MKNVESLVQYWRRKFKGVAQITNIKMGNSGSNLNEWATISWNTPIVRGEGVLKSRKLHLGQGIQGQAVFHKYILCN